MQCVGLETVNNIIAKEADNARSSAHQSDCFPNYLRHVSWICYWPITVQVARI